MKYSNTFRSMRIAAFILAALFCAAGPWAANTRAQGSRKDDVVFNSRGQPLAGATIRVCTASATTTPPCTPLALIYSDVALTQALANPTTSDGMGNYKFYAAPGRYVIEISGPSITTRQVRDVILAERSQPADDVQLHHHDRQHQRLHTFSRRKFNCRRKRGHHRLVDGRRRSGSQHRASE